MNNPLTPAERQATMTMSIPRTRILGEVMMRTAMFSTVDDGATMALCFGMHPHVPQIIPEDGEVVV
jgi:hypothetical protein